MKICMRRLFAVLCAALFLLTAAACGKDTPASSPVPGTLPVIGPGGPEESSAETKEASSSKAESVPQITETDQQPSSKEQPTEPRTTEAQTTEARPTEPQTTEARPTEPQTTEPQTEEPTTQDAASDWTLPANVTGFRTEGTNGYVIVIDPGHQEKGNSEKEPVGPGATETKAKVSSGTASRFNGYPEYKVNMEVALKLRQILLERGYTVIMTRTGNAVNISNIERATIANDAHADAFVRLHCNGSENNTFHGIGIYYQTPNNPYNGDLHDEAKALNSCLLEHMLSATGARRDGLIESDTYSGINWCKVPAGLVEMGYMTNQEEDAKLQDQAYQQKLAVGIADGIDEFVSTRAPKN